MAGFRGDVARIDWGYFAAAGIKGFSITGDARVGGLLRGRVIVSDSFKLSRKPLTFVVPTTGGEMRWPIVDITVTDGTVQAQLGPMCPPEITVR